jgi:hypothetical protein
LDDFDIDCHTKGVSLGVFGVSNSKLFGVSLGVVGVQKQEQLVTIFAQQPAKPSPPFTFFSPFLALVFQL